MVIYWIVLHDCLRAKRMVQMTACHTHPLPLRLNEGIEIHKIILGCLRSKTGAVLTDRSEHFV